MKIIKCTLFTLLLYSNMIMKSKGCEECTHRLGELSVEQLKQLRYEYLKDQILRKLHLTEPPKANLPKPSLKSILVLAEMADNETIPDDEDEYKTESVVIYPIEANLTCSERQPYLCTRFDFVIPGSLSVDNFASVEISLHESNSNMSIQMYQVTADSLGNRKTKIELNTVAMEKHPEHCRKYIVKEYSFSVNSTYTNTFVLQIIDESKSNNSVNLFEIPNDEIPFLIIRSKVDAALFRSRRSLTCGISSTSCCKENFFLNFSEIGWDNWILHPDGYQANFCRGRCFNDLSNTRFYHSAVLLSYIRDNKDIAEEIGLNMCCTPSIMAPVTIIYRNEEGLIYTKNIENMRVEACNCA